MIKRVLTGAAFAVLVLAGVLLRGWAMFALISLAMIVSVFEMYRSIRATGVEPVCWAGYLFCAVSIAAQAAALSLSDGPNLSMYALLISVMAAVTCLVMRGKVAVDSLMVTLFPMLYPGIFYLALMDLLRLQNPAVVTVALVLAFFCASINDVFALFTGMLLGKHKLSPILSPKKTVEGSIGGLVASVLFAMAVPTLIRLIFCWNPEIVAGLDVLPPLWAFAILGLVAGGFSQIGDLAASMVKRHCGVKDFGHILPGHGGIMDRMDGILFCGVACAFFFKITGLG